MTEQDPKAVARREALDQMARDAYEAGLYDSNDDAAEMVRALRAAVEPEPQNPMADDTAREFIRCAGEAWGYRSGTEGIPDNPAEGWAKWVTGDAISVLLPNPFDWMIDLFIASWEAGFARRKAGLAGWRKSCQKS